MTVEFKPSNWTQPAASATVRTTCPYCGVGCGVLATPDGKGGAVIKGDPDHPANAGRLCSKGSALGETLGPGHPAAAPDRRWRAHQLGPRARSGCEALAGRAIRARAGGHRLLPFRPTPHRGLLCRQQAGERLHRHAPCRHQLAPVHGLVRCRTPPRLRRRRRAAVLRRSGTDRPHRAGGLQRRLVPSGALPAHADRARGTRGAARQHRSTAHGDLRGRRLASADQARHRRISVERPAGLARRAAAD